MDIRLEITVGYNLIRIHGFKTVFSPYSFTLGRMIYVAEFISIRDALKRYNINPLNIVNCIYECGIFRPYSTNVPCTMNFDGYKIILFAVNVSSEISTKSVKDTIMEQFRATHNLEERKKVYRELIKQHHPDKEGGNTEIAKFINSFKTW